MGGRHPPSRLPLSCGERQSPSIKAATISPLLTIDPLHCASEIMHHNEALEGLRYMTENTFRATWSRGRYQSLTAGTMRNGCYFQTGCFAPLWQETLSHQKTV